MNPILQQLLSVAPGIGAAIGGDGHATQAFMEGYQRTLAQLEQQKRLKQQDQFTQQDRQTAADDRQRLIARQTEADQRAGEIGKQQDYNRSLDAVGQITQSASNFDDPAQAKSFIESMMPNLMSVYGQGAMALGQPAVEQAQQVITGRQKKQVKDYLGDALKTEHVINNPDVDPLLQLPDHIAKMIGKPEARLSEVQTFAQMPVGKPAKPIKERMPAAAGSFEDYVQAKYGENPTPDQILEARKVYQQVDDRAPKVTVNTGQGAYPAPVQSRINAITKGFDSQPIVKKTQTMAEAVSFADGLDPNTKNPADDQALIYAFAKAMDPDSVVREGEYATVQKYAQSWADSFGFDVKRMFSNSPFLTPEARANMKATIRAKFAAGKGQYENIRREYGRRIERVTGKPGGIDELTDYGAAFPSESLKPTQAAPTQTAGPRVGERRKAPDGGLVEYDGKGWFKVGG